MIEYPTKIQSFYTTIVNLPDFGLQLNDLILVSYGNTNLETQLRQEHIDILSNPDSDIILNYCKISYNDEVEQLHAIGLLPDHDIKYVAVSRPINNYIYNFAVKSKIPMQLQLNFDNYTLKVFDKLIYYVNNKQYTYTFTQSEVNSIKSPSGWIANTEGHIIIYTETYTGKKLTIKLPNLTDSFSQMGTYYDFSTGKVENSFYIISVQPNIGSVDIYGNIQEGDSIDVVLNSTSQTLTFTATDIQTLLYNGNLIRNDYVLYLNKNYDYIYMNANITINLLKSTDNLNSAVYKQKTSKIMKFSRIVTKFDSEITADPSYDSEFELQNFSKSELDHRKGRCICSIPGIINKLKELKQTNPTNIQEQLDHIMDYDIYPNVCDLSTKQYLYDTYGPFTSPRPI